MAYNSKHTGEEVEEILDSVGEKQDKLTAGDNITISSDNVISASGGGESYKYVSESGNSLYLGNTNGSTGHEPYITIKDDSTNSELIIEGNGSTTKFTKSGIEIIENDINGTLPDIDMMVKNFNVQSSKATYNGYEIATERDLEKKQDVLTAGDGITIANNVISASGGGGYEFITEENNTLYIGNYPQDDNSLITYDEKNGLKMYFGGITICNDKSSLHVFAPNDINGSMGNVIIDGCSEVQVNPFNGFTYNGYEVATENDLSTKQDKLTAGDGITIANNVISASGGEKQALLDALNASDLTSQWERWITIQESGAEDVILRIIASDYVPTTEGDMKNGLVRCVVILKQTSEITGMETKYVINQLCNTYMQTSSFLSIGGLSYSDTVNVFEMWLPYVNGNIGDTVIYGNYLVTYKSL